ncbi:hypothetical protein GobsT_68470 [Gemmata obscuriglobus]|uniref:Uncharacterized protein n=1 Tax=Gemmata obscuriglobus TaxID=114 RepID=A0A2Z3HAP0_9BACT|nr:hypothetical protein [Gemmata obscuriglobus]AWM42011.1 hypothetical protein C1280_36825 [Gemmata obscuriglobus]QEG31998.1 hypothetical protein GobsT_68470 [Gemmata obscuriglobus]VTS11348.1 unnamed protein product [Gemmata obscuriglobus UQM 2246]
MAEDAKQKFELRLVPAEGRPDPVVFDDLVKLIRQGIATAPKQAPQISTAGEFSAPSDGSQNALETQVRHRIEQVSNLSVADVAKRAEIAKQPDGEVQLADEALAAAQEVVAAVQRMLLRGIAVQVPPDTK